MKMTIDPNIFRAYDIRGIYPKDINEENVFLIAKAYIKHFNVKKVVVAGDVRISTPSLKASLIKGLIENGAEVIDIGTVTTDMMYFGVVNQNADGGIMVSASHNPKEYNGLKIVLKDAEPVGSESGLFELRDLLLKKTDLNLDVPSGTQKTVDIISAYVQHVRSFIDFSKIKPLTVVANPSFGMAGIIAKQVVEGAPITFHFLNETPNGEFPKGPPNPLLPENQGETSQFVKDSEADMGVAWDADADRCFFFNEKGDFVPPYYISALFSHIILRNAKGGKKEKILHDPRLTWVIDETVKKDGGISVLNKSGYVFIKERMKKEDIIFGAETSAHYFFRNNYYSDNGMIPFLLILEELSVSGKKLSELIAPFKVGNFISGELNFKIAHVKEMIGKITDVFRKQGGKMSEIDGVSFEFDTWRFNIRGAANEPLIRLNIESRNKKTLDEKVTDLTSLITSK